MKKSIFVLLITIALTSQVSADLREKAKYYFDSNQEPVTIHATWGSENYFRVTVKDNGKNRNDYARHVCNVLINDVGIKNTFLHVGVYDADKLADNVEWVKLGGYRCFSKQ